jgi:peptidoglycan hydrolase-like protein with peptidoglycan-binding domain
LAADPQKPVAKQTVKEVPTNQGSSKQVLAKPTVKSAIAKSSPTKATYAKAAPAKSTVALKPAAKKAAVWPRYYAPQQPAPERYKEIQQALVDKGYFSGSPDGVWGATSTDALKRFQHDQNLNEDGKLDSLSIIALGLGPNRAATNVEQPATK